MKKRIIAFIISAVMATSVCMFFGCKNEHTHTYGEWVEITAATTTSAGQRERVCESCGEREIEEIPAIEDKTKYYDGGYVNILPSVISKYLAAENKAEYLYNFAAGTTVADKVKGVSLGWVKTSAPYKLVISTDKDYKENTEEKIVKTFSTTLYNLLPSETYYYKVIDANENLIKTDSFRVKDGLRPIYCGNILNMRDTGGKTANGGVIKYGLVYRSPEIADADTTAKRIITEDLGIKTEIDLRLNSTTPSISDSITKHTLGILQWDYLFPGMNSDRPASQVLRDNLKKIFELFADESNYPIVFHCSAGADRTGTLAFLLNGLLGASYEELAEDFEITSFYFGKRWRSEIIEKNGKYVFGEGGAMQDNEGNLVAFDRTYKHIMKVYKTESGTLSDAIANYLKTSVGVTDSDILSIKNIMIKSEQTTF